MPPRKAPRSLLDITMDSLTTLLSTKYRTLNLLSNVKSTLELREIVDCLPVPLLELLVTRLTDQLIGKDREMGPFYNSFKSFPLHKLTQLDFTRLFHGFRLARIQNTEFKDFCLDVVGHTPHLTKLVLIAKCTDRILGRLGACCPTLRELNVSLSDDISDTGLLGLASTEKSSNCANLRLLDLTKCWDISPRGVSNLIQCLTRLKRLCYSNMRAVAVVLTTVDEAPERFQASYDLDYFECTEPSNLELSVLQQEIVFQLFPKLSTVKLLISDEDVATLVSLSGLQHVELEFMNSPGEGFYKFFKHHSSQNLSQIVLQIASITADCLQIIAENCTCLKVFKFTGTSLEGEEKLVPKCPLFSQLVHLEFKLYNSEGLYSSDEDGGESCPEVHPQIFHFFLQNCVHLTQFSIHLNCARFMNLEFLSRLLAVNPLVHCEKFWLDGPVPLPLDSSAVDLLLSTLPSVMSIHISRWEGISERCLAEYRKEGKVNNLDLEFF